jgi:hypothetical protein
MWHIRGEWEDDIKMDFNSRLEAWAGLIWLMIGAGGGFSIEPSYSIKFGVFFFY